MTEETSKEETKKATLFGKKKKTEEKEKKEESISDATRLENGQVHCRVIIEILGKPKDYVESAIREYIEKIEKDKRYFVVKKEFSKPEDVEAMFSIYAEIDMWFKNLNNVLDLCYDYMPSSMEFLEPVNIQYKSSEFSGFINDMQARLHNTDMLVKNLRAENTKIKINMHYLLRNTLLIALSKGEQTIDQLSKVIGIKADGLNNLIAQIMDEEKRIKKKGDKYHLAT